MTGVTFVLPTFNGERYVRQAISGITAQRDSGWQALIIDDASQDDTEEIVRSCLSPKISYVKNESNIGLYGTLDRALRLVDTEYVSIVHQDDRLHDDYLETLLPIVEQNKEVNAFWVGQDTVDASGTYLARGLHANRVANINPGVRAWVCGMQRGCFWTISGSLTRQSLFQRFPFRTDLPHMGDYHWLLRVLRSTPMTYVGKPLIDIRQHAGQASARHLSNGRDVHDEFVILSENLRRYTADVRTTQILAICGGRARMVGRRALIALARRRWTYAAWLNRYAVRYLHLAVQMTAEKRRI